ncbi:DUF397 domain-containing protein [Lentzea sp. NEAU-D7]|uniref:DUF397 domain-containing protein n=1 Tax=Lentzea sp. NEAU-D7 TaxID=2994667 RepID=UPI00224A94BD|nr:DUF397 domain-containing protein [Lentzea sp. NEAU-D7]MCX2949976.1 DUF397 domain-containing protein [Lentzea sp. NEAU-D7]
MGTLAADTTGGQWRKSSYSNGGNDAQCVEVRPGAVRDSKNPAVVLEFGAQGWQRFVKHISNG